MNDTTQNKKNIQISTEQINKIVKVFYAKVRVHPSLGPIFNGVLGEIETNADIWEFHEEKISLFWHNVLLKEGDYSSNLMATHMQLPEIKDELFTQWLDLFDGVLTDVLPKQDAEIFSAKAHVIGNGLRRTIGIMSDI